MTEIFSNKKNKIIATSKDKENHPAFVTLAQN